MTIADQIKILNRAIMQNEAQYDLDRKAAKISTLSSNNLDKYEYLTGEDLGLKPSTVGQAKFEYSPLGKMFKLAKAIFLFGFLRLSLSVKSNLSLCGSLVFLFSVFMKIVSIFK